MKYKFALVFAILVSAISMHAYAVDWKFYNENKAFVPSTLPNGSVANATEIQKVMPLMRIEPELGHVKVLDNVWLMTGPFYAPAVVETPNGLIVVNSGESAADGTRFRKYIREHISQKPVLAILYDHAHYQYGSKTLADGDKVIVVGNPIANELEATKSAGGFATSPIPELLTSLSARSAIQFGAYLPDKGPDAMAAAINPAIGEKAFLPVTHPLHDGESIVIDGLEVVGYTAETDSPDAMTYYIPSLKLVFENALWPAQNTYTLRGDTYRSPVAWMAALRQIRDLEPEVLIGVGGGTRPLKGKEKIRQAIEEVHDSMAFIYDQSIRLINRGVKGDQLKHYIHLPASLRSASFVSEFYGQFDSFPEAYAVANGGWFSGYAEDMHNLPEQVYSKKMVSAMGGVDAVYSNWKKAFDEKEYLWAKELAVLLYHNAPDDKQARQALADTFRKLGQMSPGTIVRNFYINAARSLEGDKRITMMKSNDAQWVEAHPGDAVNYLRTRLNPDLAEGKSGFLVFDIDGKKFGLDIRNSIAEYVPDVNANYRPATETIKVTAERFAKYYTGELPARDISDSSLLALFDEFRPVPMY